MLRAGGGLTVDKRTAKKVACAMLACEGLRSMATTLLASCDLRDRAGDDAAQIYLKSCGAS